MQRITMSARFRGEAAAPSGEPPRTDPRAASISLEAARADGSDAGLEQAAYSNHVTFTSETTFVESGTMTFGDDGALELDTVGEGTIGPSAEPNLMHGAVIWRITGGSGRFDGATGLVTSNFLLSATGEFEEHQIATVFLP